MSAVVWREGGILQRIWAIYPPKKIVAPKVRAFIAIFERCFRAPTGWSET